MNLVRVGFSLIDNLLWYSALSVNKYYKRVGLVLIDYEAKFVVDFLSFFYGNRVTVDTFMQHHCT